MGFNNIEMQAGAELGQAQLSFSCIWPFWNNVQVAVKSKNCLRVL